MNDFNIANKSTETSAIEQYACVMDILASYVAVHVIRKPVYEIKSISNHVDIKVVQSAAEHFAKEKEIEFKPYLLTFEKPIMTIYKKEGVWFPAKIYTDRVFFVYNFEGYPLNGDKDRAIQTAEKLAALENLYFTSGIGIAASENNV